MRKRWWLLWLAVVPVAVWGYDGLQKICWVGFTDLEIVFVVTDVDSGRPVEGAKIAVHTGGGIYREHEEKPFELVTDADGTARRVCHDSMCSGTQSGLAFTDTFAVHLPWWDFRVTAPGFRSSQRLLLDVAEYGHQVQRLPDRSAQLVVRVPLLKK
jgi:hypothetical protein